MTMMKVTFQLMKISKENILITTSYDLTFKNVLNDKHESNLIFFTFKKVIIHQLSCI